jgi:hypothetical protein
LNMPKIDPVKLAAEIEARQAKGISRDPGTVLSWKIPKSSAEEIAAQEAERRARGEKYARELAEAETLELSVEQIAHRFHEEGKAITKEQLKRLERASREPRISVQADVSLNQIGEVAEALPKNLRAKRKRKKTAPQPIRPWKTYLVPRSVPSSRTCYP